MSYDVGATPLEVWVRDQAGNTATCNALAYLDPGGSCDSGMAAEAKFPGNDFGIPGVKIDIAGTRCPGDTLKISGETYAYPSFPELAIWKQFGASIPGGYSATVTPTKDTNPANGITMNDLFLISQHLLGITPLTNPYQMIAADADQDGQVTFQDRLILRRLMSGIIHQLPNGRSWRFVPADYVFIDPLHPFPFPERAEVLNTDYPVPQYFQFIGIKIGDVDFSADVSQ